MTTSLLKNQSPTPIARLDYEVQRFADLAVLCHDSRSRLKTMALITACGDESSDKDQRVLAVGAFVGPADEWTALLLDWIERIKPHICPVRLTRFIGLTAKQDRENFQTSLDGPRKAVKDSLLI
jgi:hypothetical protein